MTTALAVDLLAEPHHDTGPAYLTGERAPGAVLKARLWVPSRHQPAQVLLRQVVDGEPRITPMDQVSTTAAGSWWTGPVRLVNPVNHYRFLLVSPDGEEPYLWRHAAGLSNHDVPDATDFRVLSQDQGPQWVLDSVCYQVFPDRFATTGPKTDLPGWAQPHRWLDEPPVGGDPSARAFYGGDLDGVAAHLDWIQALGADTVYLTPVFPAGSTHRYDATSFERVDPLLGGDEALARLSQALHERGMRLVLDLTTNHTGVSHEWFRAAQADASSPEASFYTFVEHPHAYTSWLSVTSLPDLDHRSQALRERLLLGPASVTARWLLPPVEADGWRVDVANMTGRQAMVDLSHQVAADMRSTMREVEATTGRPHWLVAEHGHDAAEDLTGPGWHGVMNYFGFTKPVWAWLSNPDPADEVTWFGIPVPPPQLPAEQVVRGLRQYTAQVPATAIARSMNLLGSHDTPRARTVLGSRDRQLVAVTALFTAPGVPTVFAGDELGATGRTGEHSRTTMPWLTGPDGAQAPAEVGARGAWGEVDHSLLPRYQQLAALRRDLVALRRGGTRWVLADGDLVAWVRTHPAGDVLVVLARAAAPTVRLPLEALHTRAVVRCESLDAVSVKTQDQGACLVVSANGPGSAIAVLEPSTLPGAKDDDWP